jgi:acetyltransferase-like isoleucine patch superfamily enzyme
MSASPSLRARAGRPLMWITNHVVSRIYVHGARMWWYRTVMGYSLADGALIQVGVRFAGRGRVTMGEHSLMNNGCLIDNRGQIVIGRSVSLSYGTTIWTKGHAIDDPEFRTTSGSVTIQDRVWTCAGSVVLPGVTMGEGSVSLTSSVVTKDVEPWTVVGGNPAVPVRRRSADIAYDIDNHRRPWMPFWG